MSEIRVLEYPDFWNLKNPATGGAMQIPRDGRWSFNGDFERPTFSPSINETVHPYERPVHRNHYFVRDGRIEYLSDCTHSMAGQTVELPPFTEAQVEFHKSMMEKGE